MIYLHLKAKNDPSGNPQRLFVVVDRAGNTVDVIDEGYRGHGAVREQHPGACAGPTLEIPKKEYHAIKREWREWGALEAAQLRDKAAE